MLEEDSELTLEEELIDDKEEDELDPHLWDDEKEQNEQHDLDQDNKGMYFII